MEDTSKKALSAIAQKGLALIAWSFCFIHLYVRASTLFNSTSATSQDSDDDHQMVKDTDKYDSDDDYYDDADHDYHLEPLHHSQPEEDDDEDDQGSPPGHHIPEAGEDDSIIHLQVMRESVQVHIVVTII